VERGFVVRMPKAYPYYDKAYEAKVDVLRGWLAEHAPNVHPVGRNGMFRYNNQDHSMLTAQLTVQNIVEGTQHDVWEVNVEEDYHEEASPSSADDAVDPQPSLSAAAYPSAPPTASATGSGSASPASPASPASTAR